MLLTNFSLNIGADEGFTKNDLFNHNALGKKLAGLLSEVDHPITVALNAQWGQGKTTFLRMWAGYLRSKGFPVVEFDAFENDYYSDPFIPLAGEVTDLAKSYKGLASDLAGKATRVGLALAKGGAKLGVKAITLGLLDGKAADEITSDIADGISDYAEKEIESIISSYKKDKGELSAFKDALSELSSLINPRKSNGELPKPLIFIIDELDRCRPDYALKLLERVKHLYSVPNVHFIFGVHLDQLENCVKAAYGNNIDASLYLEKFFTIKLDLPDSNSDTFKSNRSTYISRILSGKNIRVDPIFLEYYFLKKNASLRRVEKIMQEYIIIYSSKRTETLNAYLLLLLCIKSFDGEIFSKILKKECGFSECLDIVRQYQGTSNETWNNFLANILSETDLREVFGSFRMSMTQNFNQGIANSLLNWIDYAK